MTVLREIKFRVNGVEHQLSLESRKSLADTLREDLRLTGTHVGCEQGACGACTILLDGEPVRSCLMFGVQANGHEIETVESLATVEGELNGLQRAFKENHGLQCGFCTPGMLMVLTAYLRQHEGSSETQVREAISGQICRCTGYQQIVDAVLSLAGQPS